MRHALFKVKEEKENTWRKWCDFLLAHETESKKQEPDSLLSRVHQDPRFTRIRWYRLDNLKQYIEYPYLTLFIGTVFVSCVILSSFGVPTAMFKFDSMVLAAITSGLGAIIIALFVFVAQNFKDSEEGNLTTAAIFRYTFLYELTLMSVIAPFGFLLGGSSVSMLISILVVAIVAIISIIRLNLIIVKNRDRLEVVKDEVLDFRVRDAILESVEERMAENIFLKELENSDSLKHLFFDPWSDRKDEMHKKYHVIEAKRVGDVRDIYFSLLQRANTIIDSLYRERYGEKFVLVKEAGVDTDEDIVEWQPFSDKGQGKIKLSVRKKLRDEIGVDDKELVLINKRTGDEELDRLLEQKMDKLSGVIQSAYLIGTPQTSLVESLTSEWEEMRHAWLLATTSGDEHKTKRLTRRHVRLVERFMEIVGPFNVTDARKEVNTFLGGWDLVRLVSDSIRTVVKGVAQKGEFTMEALRNVTYAPFAIANRAIKQGDHYVFQEFIRFPALLYFVAHQLNNDTSALKGPGSYLLDRSWRYLDELIKYHIQHPLIDAYDIDTIKNMQGYAISSLVVWQDLLKAAIDNKDHKALHLFLDKLGKSFDLLNKPGWRSRKESKHLQNELEYTQDTERQVLLEKQIGIAKVYEEVTTNILSTKSQILFWVSAFVFDKYRRDGTSEMFNVININKRQYTNNLQELTDTLKACLSFRKQDDLKWDFWAMNHDSEEAQTIDVNSVLYPWYVVLALRAVASLRNDLEEINLIIDTDLSNAISERGNILKILETVKQGDETWKLILRDQDFNAEESLRKILARALELYKDKEKNEVADNSINEEKIQEFVEETEKSFVEGAQIESIARDTGNLVTFDSLSTEKKNTWGFNTIYPKEAFFKNWHTQYVGSSGFGADLAHSEDAVILQKMLEGTDGCQVINWGKEVLEFDPTSYLQDAIKKQPFDNPIILSTLSPVFRYKLKGTDGFIDRYLQECPVTKYSNNQYYIGVFSINGGKIIIPVFDLFVRKDDLRNILWIGDFKNFGVLETYIPSLSDAKEGDITTITTKSGVFIEVLDLNKDKSLRQKILENEPDWLKEKDNKETYLRRKVRIRVYRTFDFRITESHKGACFKFQRMSD